MDHIEQLKKIRSDAIARLRACDDYTLAGKLGALIAELGDTVDDTFEYGEDLEGVRLKRPLSSSAAHAERHPFEQAFAKNNSPAGTSDALEPTQETVVDLAELDEFSGDMEYQNGSHGAAYGDYLDGRLPNSTYSNGSSH